MRAAKVGRTGPDPAATSMRIFAVAALLCVVNIGLHFPGEMNPDSTGQYMEVLSGKYTDWHPPIMAAWWSVLRRIADGPVTMLVFHLVLHWAGFALLSDSLMRVGRRRSAWWMLAAGAFPLFLLFNGGILKDVGMASTLIAAVGACRWYRCQQRPIPWAAGLLIAALVAYGTLVRTNAVFAFGPLVVYMLAGRMARLGLVRFSMVAIVLSALALPASSLINRDVFHATSAGAARSLQIFNLAGIARYAEDARGLQDLTGESREFLASCYTPYWWDPFSAWGNCRQVWGEVAEAERRAEGTTTRTWMAAIRSHPLPYLLHRLAYFNSMLYFLVPADHFRFSPSLTGAPVDRSFTVKSLVLDLLKRNPLFLPLNWLVLAVAMLVVVSRRPPSDETAVVRALILSGVFYTGAYLVVGVATALRYHYWLVMACLVAAIIVLPTMDWRKRWRDPVVTVTSLALAVVMVASLAFRVADISLFVR